MIYAVIQVTPRTQLTCADICNAANMCVLLHHRLSCHAACIYITRRSMMPHQHKTSTQCWIKYDTTRHDTIRYDTIRYDTIRYDTIRYDTIRYDTIRYDTIRYDTIRYDTIRGIGAILVQHLRRWPSIKTAVGQHLSPHAYWDTIQYDTIRYDTIQYDTIRSDMIRYDTIR